MGSKQDRQDRQHRQGLWVGILVLAIVVCVWLVPISPVTAASSSSDFAVTVTVQDAITVDMSEDVMELVGSEDVEVRIVTRTGSGPLAGSGERNGSFSEVVITASRL